MTWGARFRVLPHDSVLIKSSLCVAVDAPFDPHRNHDGPNVGQVEVASLIWSPTSERLAVSFEGDSPGSDLIAVFDTCQELSMTSFNAIGYIRGPPSQDRCSNKPVSMAFLPHFTDGALLSVVWTDGQISSYPLYFARSTFSPAANPCTGVQELPSKCNPSIQVSWT